MWPHEKATQTDERDPIGAQPDPTHLALGALDSGSGQRHYILQLGQLGICGPSETGLGALLELSQLGLQLVRLPSGDVHLDR